MKRFFQVTLFVLLLILALFKPAIAMTYKITLKDGSFYKWQNISEKPDQYCTVMYGGSVCLSKKDVKSLESIDEKGVYKTIYDGKVSEVIKEDTAKGGEPQMIDSESDLDRFYALVQSLIEDAVDIMPDELVKKIAPNKSTYDLMGGVYAFSTATPLAYSPELDNYGKQAAYIAYKIYGDPPPKKIEIPQAIFYNGHTKTEINKVQSRILEGKKDIEKSQNSERDTYNLAFGILVDLWIDNFKKLGGEISKYPQKGVYIRDSEGSLYLYERG